jgi:P27 family predicted phage terminase small subunit
MAAGRKPKPTRLKLLAGNPGKRPLNTREPAPELATPERPPELDDVAAAEWARVCPELAAIGVLTRLDRSALAAYCQSWSQWLHAIEKLKTTGPVVKAPSGFPIQNPYFAIANSALKQMKAFLTEFGMTPSSRSRIHAGELPGDKDDAEERFFGGA